MTGRATLAGGLALLTGLTLAGCSTEGSPELKVVGAFMPQPVSDIAAAFLVVENAGSATDRLTAVTSPISDHVTIHETKGRAMRMVASFEVPAQGELDLERGGNHIMFDELKRQPKKGQKISVQLHFEKSGPITVELPVEETTYNPAKQ
ncbi:copper chaperone PCu(A)C [Streptomyces sp. NBC_01218]|uniref:copper chaperone PCu(A)C n=1 Tax=Streptomyces sp. NBC_01218 TaxID=2903780 RepID=UPI002E1264F1|nr:copper chaperone PCu(A)C [Streptomyces sp. NBC_01218]